MDKKKLLFGCVSDDFTGGSDAASFMALGGLKTVLLNGIPEADFELPADCDGVVIAQKSRTQETAGAVADSLAAVRWMKERGAKQIYFKYCSTFDSTPKGNIGPVTDAIMRELDVPGTLLCPALPANDRRVRGGVLYVNGVPLAESPMRNHPLTPMTRSRIAELMAPQGAYDSMEISLEALHGDSSSLKGRLTAFAADREHYYLIPDCDSDADSERIVELFGDMAFLTGGSGLLTALARRITGRQGTGAAFGGICGRAIILVGSCSTATHGQTLWYEAHGGRLYRLTDENVLEGSETAETVWDRIASEDDSIAPLVYAYDTPEGLAAKRGDAGKALAGRIEEVLAGIAVRAYKNGFTRIICAGGETSGAVTRALGFRAFWIGESLAPGVPVMIPVENRQIRLVLKSGNFGQEEFFGRALKRTGREK